VLGFIGTYANAFEALAGNALVALAVCGFYSGRIEFSSLMCRP
jgi:hypothetical protein